ncbi:Potassium channel KAT1, partial [Mucuna pruriens]
MVLVTQRDTVRAASEFASRNHLPHHIQDQMLSHLCLKFKTEGLKQQETLSGMPKAIRASIASHLFFPVLQKVYLFHGVSHHFLFQLVPEMEAEFFPPKEDVILQNESPTDLYMLVSGAVDLIRYDVDGNDQVVEKAIAGDTFGEIGVLYCKPQPFTVRTTELSQILRLSRTSLMTSLQSSPEAEQIIMKNIFMRLKGHEGLDFEYPPRDPGLGLYQMQDWDNTGRRFSDASTKSSQEARLHNMIPEDGKRDPHATLHKGHPGMEANEKNLSPIRWKQKPLVEQQQNKSILDLAMNHEPRKTLDEHIIEFLEPEIPFNHPLGKVYTNSYSSTSNHRTERETERFLKRRVTIHFLSKDKTTMQEQHGKLIILPDSLEELLHIAGEKFGGFKPTKVINTENAEIDDIGVIRDGDHLKAHELSQHITLNSVEQEEFAYATQFFTIKFFSASFQALVHSMQKMQPKALNCESHHVMQPQPHQYIQHDQQPLKIKQHPTSKGKPCADRFAILTNNY